jgi:DNA repair exonuclease SbcCD ATPase subunit
MFNCPVCHAKHNEGQESCSVCKWPLDRDPQKIMDWAQDLWATKKKYTNLKKQYQTLAIETKIEYINSLEEKVKEFSDRLSKFEQSEDQGKEFSDQSSKFEQLEDRVKEFSDRLSKFEDFDLKYQSLPSQMETLQNQVGSILSEQRKWIEIQEKINKINDNSSNLEETKRQWKEKFQENHSIYQHQLQEIQSKLEDLENNILANELANRKMVSNQSSYPSETSVSYPELSPQTQNPISLEESNLARKYNDNRDAFSQQAINVTATEDSLTKLEIGISSGVIFEKNRRGNYSIIKENGTEYLVPSNNLRLNQHNYKTIEDFFDCNNLQLEGNFELLKPARVSALPGGETWQFEERGILQF